ncbi:MAG: hypothetical protein ACI9VR_004723 [Cognaticolwellia sp.]|jgi:hypothetical protein
MLIALSLLVSLTACEQDPDADGDGSPASLDCDEGNPNINPDAAELCDGVDNDCDGLVDDDDDDVPEEALDSWYTDSDGDGFGSSLAGDKACEGPTGTSNKGGDCAEDDPLIFPGAPEICDGLDNDCDGVLDDEDTNLDTSSQSTWYLDRDGDGYGDPDKTTSACDVPAGYAADSSDCDDSSESINPAASEICNDGLDNDCSGDAPECVFSGEYGLDQAELVLVGSTSGQGFGSSLGVDDFNGDGQVDLVVGVPGSSRFSTNAGEVYVFSQDMEPGSPPSATANFVSFNSQARTGADVAMMGDVSGDGYPDLLIGNQADNGEEMVLLYRGTSAGLGSKAYVFSGERGLRDGDEFGSEVASVGDLNRDGVADIAIGASGVGERAGAVYLWQAPGSTNESSDAHAVITGQAYDYLGQRDTVMGADLDGDGYSDLLTGAPSQARFYLNYGEIRYDIDAQDSDVVILGVDEDDQLGQSPASGDMDRDGYEDIIVGAMGERDKTGARVGATHIFYGAAARPSAQGSSSDSTTQILGSNAYDGTGSAHVVGDVDGDGELDLLIGQAGVNDFAGAAYLFYGPLPEGPLSVESADAVLFGEESGMCGATGTLAIADLDLDSHADLIMGCPSNDNSESGKVSVFFGISE